MFLNVVLGHKRDLTDCAENLDKENPTTRSLLSLRLVSTFQKSAAKSCKIGQRFIVANDVHGPHSPMSVPKRCLGTQTRPDRVRGEPRQGEPFHALTPLAPTRADFSEISSQELQDRAAFQCCKCHAWMPVADECS